MNAFAEGAMVSDRPFNVVRREDLDPICPHCNARLTEVYYKAKGPGWFLFPVLAIRLYFTG